MITYDKFITLIEEHEKQQDRMDKLSDAGFSIFETDVVDFGYRMFEACIDMSFNDDGRDLIYFWLYELKDKEEYFFTENEENKVYARNASQLWDIVKDYRI